ncbi:MAG: malate dehydrogenase, partial [Acidobacteria bacterium]|nr:malate dehydrogenase [Acidobacteriota bacterium]
GFTVEGHPDVPHPACAPPCQIGVVGLCVIHLTRRDFLSHGFHGLNHGFSDRIPVTNPLDAMCQVVYRESGFPRERVVGMAGVLDSARMRTFIADALKVSVENVHAFVLGGHGDTMVPLPRYCTVAGIPITELLDTATIDAIVTRTANGGAEIVKLLGTGSAYYAPSSAIVQMVEAILKDKKRILPCAVFLQGEYGIRDLFVGVPVKLGAGGAEQVIEIRLEADEQVALDKSAASVKELVGALDL